MASINGITLHVKKLRDKEGTFLYSGELFARGTGGLEKIADWCQTKDGRDKLIPVDGFGRKEIISAIKGTSAKSLEDVLYDAATLTEYESWFRKAKKDGFFGIALVEGKNKYIGKNIFSEEKNKNPRDLLKEETQEMSESYQNEDFKYLIFTAPTDFIIGNPIDIEELKIRKTEEKRN